MSGDQRSKEILKRFGANLRRERMALGISQQLLAERAELNVRTVQKIEAGETNILVTTVMRLREAIACPWERLMR